MPRTANYSSPKLTRSQVKDVIAASEFADAQSSPLNMVLHIHWHYTAFANSDRRKAVASLLESQRHWCLHRKLPFLSILVRENSALGGLGEHAHQLLHIPGDFKKAFLVYVRDFLRQGKKHRRQCLNTAIPYNEGKFGYLCKGSTAAGWKLVLERYPTDYERQKFSVLIARKADQGVVWGKRLFISRALGKKARKTQWGGAPALAA
jgi:hypothetical protein